jgi:hypothetical protein
MAVIIEHPIPQNVADTRQSIVRRLMTYGAERRRLEQRLVVVGELEREFQELLREVDHRDQPRLIKEESPPPTEDHLHNNAVVKELLTRALKAEPRTLADLVRIALHSGINFGEKAPSRVIHFNLLNLKNAGVINRDGDAWKIVDRD